jgi:hypothetical protein
MYTIINRKFTLVEGGRERFLPPLKNPTGTAGSRKTQGLPSPTYRDVDDFLTMQHTNLAKKDKGLQSI